jgi:hypothetical protein
MERVDANWPLGDAVVRVTGGCRSAGERILKVWLRCKCRYPPSMLTSLPRR